MAWKQRQTYKQVCVELSDFDSDQLLQALIDDGSISEIEAQAILVRTASRERKAKVLDSTAGDDELREARSCIARGWRDEALIHLERFLGREFSGRLVS